MSCSTRRYKKTGLCAGDLDKDINIETRTLGTPGPNDTVPPLVLTVLKMVWAGVKTVKGTARFDGVNIEDRPTHIWGTRYDPDIMSLETANNFVQFRGRLFRIVNVKINDEDEMIIDIETTERGIDTQLAARA